jgi:hypothetical protein
MSSGHGSSSMTPTSFKLAAHFFILTQNNRSSKVIITCTNRSLSDGGFSRGTVTIPRIVYYTEAKKRNEQRHQVLQVLSIAPTVKAGTKNSLAGRFTAQCSWNFGWAKLSTGLLTSISKPYTLLSKNWVPWLHQFWKLTQLWAPLLPTHPIMIPPCSAPKYRCTLMLERQQISQCSMGRMDINATSTPNIHPACPILDFP